MRTVHYLEEAAQAPSTDLPPYGGKRGERRPNFALARHLRKHPTTAEVRFWALVRRRRLGVRFRRQAPVLGYIVDFYAPTLLLVVEVDGLAHHAPDARASARRAWDQARDTQLHRYGFEVLRFSNKAVLHNPEAVVHRLRTAIQRHRQALADAR
jgi:very-short-patch-repair endonuclease